MKLVLAALVLGSAPASAATPIPKHGFCPDQYITSGDFCTPLPGAPPAIEKFGACPDGYQTSGGACLGLKRDAKPAVPRRPGQFCPDGTIGSGAGCVAF